MIHFQGRLFSYKKTKEGIQWPFLFKKHDYYHFQSSFLVSLPTSFKTKWKEAVLPWVDKIVFASMYCFFKKSGHSIPHRQISAFLKTNFDNVTWYPIMHYVFCSLRLNWCHYSSATSTSSVTLENNFWHRLTFLVFLDSKRKKRELGFSKGLPSAATIF